VHSERRGGVTVVQSKCSFICSARVCGRLDVANNGKKVIAWWSQELKNSSSEESNLEIMA